MDEDFKVKNGIHIQCLDSERFLVPLIFFTAFGEFQEIVIY